MNVDPITYEDLKHLPEEAIRFREERYYKVAIKTRENWGESSKRSIRANPLPNQGFPPFLNVACGTSLRKKYPVGSVFIIWAKLAYDKRYDSYYLYSYQDWETQLVDEETAKELIEQKEIGITNYVPKSDDIPRA